jgi:hypothetical protein
MSSKIYINVAFPASTEAGHIYPRALAILNQFRKIPDRRVWKTKTVKGPTGGDMVATSITGSAL